MKLFLLLVCLTFYMALTLVAGKNRTAICPGRPVKQMCKLYRDLGHSHQSWCKEHSMPEMWYYNMRHNTCNKMVYLGCGGNFNRFCTEKECRKMCMPSEYDED